MQIPDIDDGSIEISDLGYSDRDFQHHLIPMFEHLHTSTS